MTSMSMRDYIPVLLSVIGLLSEKLTHIYFEIFRILMKLKHKLKRLLYKVSC